ncbi:uncharacterized protein [Onthophagus taurus]|uniref:uncharacterized protein n=1 Tax=Onthophagus taurus TaxID=166361 RepID=UPI0039BE28CD
MHIFSFTLFNFILLSFISKVSPMHRHNNKPSHPKIFVSLRPKRYIFPRDTKELAPCDDKELIRFLADLKAINPESIVLFATESDVPGTCKVLTDKLDELDDFLGTCKVATRNLYIQLIRGVDALYDFLCNSTDGNVYKNFFPCYNALHNDYSSCVGPGDWMEYSDRNQLCNAYQDITDCYYVKTAKVCGLRAARAMKKLNLYVINKTLCKQCMNTYPDPLVPDANTKEFFVQPSVYSRKSGTKNVTCSRIILISIFIYYFIVLDCV